MRNMPTLNCFKVPLQSHILDLNDHKTLDSNIKLKWVEVVRVGKINRAPKKKTRIEVYLNLCMHFKQFQSPI